MGCRGDRQCPGERAALKLDALEKMRRRRGGNAASASATLSN